MGRRRPIIRPTTTPSSRSAINNNSFFIMSPFRSDEQIVLDLLFCATATDPLPVTCCGESATASSAKAFWTFRSLTVRFNEEFDEAKCLPGMRLR